MVLDALEDKQYEDVVHTDFGKAFDKCHHDLKNIKLKRKHIKLKRKHIKLKHKHIKLKRKNIKLKRKHIKLERKNIKLERKNIKLERKHIKLERKNIKLERKNIKLERENIKLERKNIKLKLKNIKLKRKHIKLERKNIKLERKNIKLERKNIKLERKHIKLERKNIKLERKHIKLERKHIKLERKHIKLERKHIKLERKHIKLERKHIKLERKHIKLERKHIKLERKHIKLERKHIKLERKHIKLKRKHIKLKRENIKLKRKHIKLKHKHIKLKRKNIKLKHKHIKLKRKNIKLKHKHIKLKHKHIKLKRKNIKLKHKHIKLKRKNIKLKRKHIKLKRKHIKLKRKNIKLKRKHIKLKHKHIKLKRGNIKLKRKHIKLKHKHIKLKRKHIKLKRKHIKLKRKHIKLERKNIKLERKNIKLERKNIKLERKHIKLDHYSTSHNTVNPASSSQQSFHSLQQIISKGVLIYSAKEVNHGDDVVTINIAVASTMAPRFTILVYVTTHAGEVLADALSLPVRIFDNMEVRLSMNQHKDHAKKTVEIVVGAPPGSFYAIVCERSINYFRQHPNALTHTRIIDNLGKMEPLPRTLHGVLHRSREGEFSDRLVSLPAHSYASDVLATFQDAALILLTDAPISLSPGRDKPCDISRGYLECGDGTCFLHDHLCDGRNHCSNAFDELGCERLYNDFPLQHDEQTDSLELSSDTLFRLFRTHFIMDMFDVDDLGWCNAELWIGHRGQEELQREIAKTADLWVIEGYAIHPEHGFSFTKQPIFFTGDPPFYILVEGPSVCRRGEQISIRVLLYNMLSTTIQAVLLLHDSDDYMFVHVEKDGDVQHFHPRLSRGEHQHLLFIPGEGLQEVVLPLAVIRQSGMMEVTVEAVSQFRRDTEVMEIEVKPEGVPVRKHTSMLLDLRNRALVYDFLDVAVDESPIIPLSIIRRFLYGSPAARISIAGDVFGPTLEGISVEHSQVFGGRYFRNTDGVAFNFGATLWTLHYLRLTNQLVVSEALEAFDYLAVQLAGLLWRTSNGGFSMWRFTPPSVWLTAKVINILLAAQHEDWENLLYIDPKLIQKAVKFLLKYQKPDGSFREEGEITLDSKMKKTQKASSVPLTALVTIVIHNSLSSLQGTTRTNAVDARSRAISFLESHLMYLDDCYHVAISAYALTLMGSPIAETAAVMLNKKKKSLGDMTYWSRTPIKTHLRRQENNQRGFLLPREPEQWDAHAVETTSYALLVFLVKDGITFETEKIMRWLNAIRDWDCAFISTVDTLVAMQALAEYAFRARLRDVTDMECTVEVTAQPLQQYHISIDNSSTSSLHSFELENVWGHVNLVAKGSGQAIAQLEVTWGVDVLEFIEQPHKKYFEFSVLEKYHQFRNKSIITTTVCARWLATEDGHTSSAALMEVEVPTGYMFYQPFAELTVAEIQHKGNFPQLRNVHTTVTHIFWQFDFIPGDKKQCFSYDLQRWYPAANLTAVRSATVMELFAPEHFEMVMINATPLALLDICEVCGSYQCPYCAIYSTAPSLHSLRPANIVILGLCCFVIMLTYLQIIYWIRQ
ncbi:CD109 antigen-like [Cherax quadricarinatus]